MGATPSTANAKDHFSVSVSPVLSAHRGDTADPGTASRVMNSMSVGAQTRGTRRVPVHEFCGYTHHGVPAFSNGTSNTWTGAKSVRDGMFMGYQWQCVEFARRWLWMTQRLLLPERNCAYCFASCDYVYRLRKDSIPLPSPWSPSRMGQSGEHEARATGKGAASVSSSVKRSAATESMLLGPHDDREAWERVPVKFVRQGSPVPPVADSLIVYPMSWGSPWGHIGVIVAVDLDRQRVYVADQNRYFHSWNGKHFSAVFPLELDKGRYYIRDPESDCKGWMTFPTVIAAHASALDA